MAMHPAGRGLGRRTIRSRVHSNRPGTDEVPNGTPGSGTPPSGGSGSEPTGAEPHAEDGLVRRVVRAGDSLWSIAEEVLGTTDLRRIARYWPKIHKANYQVVGRDPSLLFPGQVLVLPPEVEESSEA